MNGMKENKLRRFIRIILCYLFFFLFGDKYFTNDLIIRFDNYEYV